MPPNVSSLAETCKPPLTVPTVDAGELLDRLTRATGKLAGDVAQAATEQGDGHFAACALELGAAAGMLANARRHLAAPRADQGVRR